MSICYDVKRKLWAWMAVAVLLVSFGTLSMDAYAAELGTTVDNPVNIVFDRIYSKSWTKASDHLYCYNKIALPEQGIMTMNFSKPFDAEAEYGSLDIKVYDSRENLVWDTNCRKSKETASSRYSFSVGLAKGEYYVLVKPGFYVVSGNITTNYSFSFMPTEYCEIQPNEAAGRATLIKTNGVFYQGYFGEGDDVEESDFFKFSLTAGNTYRIRMDNYSAINASTIIMRIYSPSGEYESIRSKFNRVGEDGYDYYEYKAAETGMHYLRMDNYSGRQLAYKISIGVPPCTEHEYDEGVVTKQPTFTENGIMTYTCTVCRATRVEQMDKLTSFGWVKGGNKSYWYEDAIKQGTYNDAKGVLGDGVVRGREIYDPGSDGWYWLDACYDGAKACSKEVWIPYIYQDEKNWSEQNIKDVSYASGDMASQVVAAIHGGTGKWVRYDADGKMYKGWYTVSYSEAALYPAQVGNTYYYDPITGLMAKGYVTIDGRTYHFNEVTGVRE